MITVDTRYEFGDGSLVHIDRVTDEQVYFVAWHPGEETGAPTRMTPAAFVEALAIEAAKRGGVVEVAP